jgi:glycosyltransferase involved in cell wall biosynthesis
MIKLSIITPNYNYGHYMGQLIDSIISQNYKLAEHIIVDDGSTDNSVEVINAFASKYPDRIKLIRQENMGQTYALNRALDEVSGDIIAWINSDDFYCDNVFEKVIKEFELNLNLDAVFGDIQIVNERGELVKVNKYLPFNYTSGVFNGFGKIIPSNAIFWKRELTDTVGKMDVNFDYSMDSEYWSRLLFKRKVKHINLPIASFRWHSEAKTIKSWEKESESFKLRSLEATIIKQNSYKNLNISKYLPFELSNPLHYFYRANRFFMRFIYGHYI